MSVEEYQFFSVVAIVVLLFNLCSDIYRLRIEEHKSSNIVSIVLTGLALIGLQVGLIIATYYPEYRIFQ